MKNFEINANDFSLIENMDTPVVPDVAAGYYVAKIVKVRVYAETNNLHIILDVDGASVTHIVRSNFMRHTINELAQLVGGAPTLREFLKNLIGKEVPIYLWYNEGVNARGKYARWTNVEYTTKEDREHKLAIEAEAAAKKAAANKPIR